MPDPATRVWLTVGILDARAVRTLREILSSLAARPGIGLTIDLTTLDGQHHLTAGALLSATAHTMRGHHSTLTAHNPPGALTLTLAAIPIPTTHGQPPANSASHTHIHVGSVPPPAPAARTGTATRSETTSR
jgi:anti-anti-sigma regulatory factor